MWSSQLYYQFNGVPLITNRPLQPHPPPPLLLRHLVLPNKDPYHLLQPQLLCFFHLMSIRMLLYLLPIDINFDYL